MQARFYGVRGSYPASSSSIQLKKKILYALNDAQSTHFNSLEEIEDWVDGHLPFWVTHNYGVNTPCVQIETEGKDFIFCDAGSGLKDFSIDYMKSERSHKPATFHFFISHLHWDHIQGFPFFGPLLNDFNQIIIHGHHPQIEEAFRNQMSESYFPVTFSNLKAKIEFDIRSPKESFVVDGFSVHSIKQQHPGDSFGYRFEKEGKVIVYSTDAEHRKNLDSKDYPFVDFFRDADLLIFDGQYSFAESIDRKENWGHSSNVIGVELAARAHVKHLVIFHLDPTVSDEELDLCLLNTRKYKNLYGREDPQIISLAYEGMVVSI